MRHVRHFSTVLLALLGGHLSANGDVPLGGGNVNVRPPSLVGTWQAVSIESRGRLRPAGQVQGLRWVFSEDVHELFDGDRRLFHMPYNIDTAKTPHWITYAKGSEGIFR